MKLTRIDLNSWLVHTQTQTFLLDPWLVDPLVFFGLPWFIRLQHRQMPPFTPETLPKIDGILLSQGQPDHCHPPPPCSGWTSRSRFSLLQQPPGWRGALAL